MKDLMVELEDRPGTLAELGEALGAAGVNISGIAGFRAGSAGVVHVLVEDGDAAKGALEGAGANVVTERDVLMLDLENRPGSVGEVARKLADADINIDLIYVASDNRIVLSTEDLDAARRAIG
ncbi:MAG TPA: ACT domain-containing protein [Actinomycetota bacterium]